MDISTAAPANLAAAASSAASVASAIPFSTGGQTATFSFPSATLILGLLLVSLLVVAWSRKRNGSGWMEAWTRLKTPATATEAIPRHVSTLRLDGATRLHVIAWDDRQFLIVAAPGIAPSVIATKQSDQR